VGRVALTAAKARPERLARLVVAGRHDGGTSHPQRSSGREVLANEREDQAAARRGWARITFHFPLLGVVRSTYSPRL
jgi:hypothetical protein